MVFAARSGQRQHRHAGRPGHGADVEQRQQPMTSRQRQISIAAGALAVVLAGVVYWFWRPANNVNAPRGVWFICPNDSCKNEFSMSMAEFSDHHAKHYGQPV